MSERDELIAQLELLADEQEYLGRDMPNPLLAETILKRAALLSEAATALRADGARPAGAQQWKGPFFVACDKCVTATHCANHGRCLSECVPADLAAAPSPTGAPTPPQEPPAFTAEQVEAMATACRKATASGPWINWAQADAMLSAYAASLRDATTRTT